MFHQDTSHLAIWYLQSSHCTALASALPLLDQSHPFHNVSLWPIWFCHRKWTENALPHVPIWPGHFIQIRQGFQESTPAVWPCIILHSCWPWCSHLCLQQEQHRCIMRHICYWWQASLPIMAKGLRFYLSSSPIFWTPKRIWCTSLDENVQPCVSSASLSDDTPLFTHVPEFDSAQSSSMFCLAT